MSTRDDIRAALYAEQAQQRQELYPLATWHAFSPDQLADVIAGVARMGLAPATRIAQHLNIAVSRYEFSTQRRDPGGVLIGGALWRIERDGVSAYVLHLLQSEPEGTA